MARSLTKRTSRTSTAPMAAPRFLRAPLSRLQAAGLRLLVHRTAGVVAVAADVPARAAVVGIAASKVANERPGAHAPGLSFSRLLLTSIRRWTSPARAADSFVY